MGLPHSTTQPLLSVCVPLYNKAATLDRTLHTLSRQGIEQMEVVIVDNASTDDSQAVATRWLDRLAIRIVSLPATISLVDNWLLSLSPGRGRYLKLQLAGDTVPDDSFRKMLDALESDPTIGGAWPDGRSVTERRRRQESVYGPRK